MEILTALNRILAPSYSVSAFAEETTRIGKVASISSLSLNCSETDYCRQEYHSQYVQETASILKIFLM